MGLSASCFLHEASRQDHARARRWNDPGHEVRHHGGLPGLLVCREYTIGEKFSIWRGKFSGDKILWDQMIGTDLTKVVPKLDIPVYFFHGSMTTPSPIRWPRHISMGWTREEGVLHVENSAHSPMFEEPARMRQIIEQDVFAGANLLADRT